MLIFQLIGAAAPRPPRNPSVGSQRYHSDPLRHIVAAPHESAMTLSTEVDYNDHSMLAEHDNYLIPNSQMPADGRLPSSSASSVSYTPIVTGASNSGIQRRS